METIRVETAQNVFIHYPLSSIGDRILAYLFDTFVLILYIIAVFAFFINIEVTAWWLWIMAIGVPFLLFRVSFEIFMNGQTPGKRIMKIKVARLDGTPPTVGNYLLRWIFGFVDFNIMSGAIAVLIISVGGKGQRLGDIVAGTCVVKLIKQEEITASEIFIVPEENYVQTYPQVMMLSERDIETIQKALEANRTHGNMQPVLLVAEKIKTLLNIQTELDADNFLLLIIKDFNHITSR
jgi:uncharacterized RDD family membrane protein YckC